jgi:hypothetical protein
MDARSRIVRAALGAVALVVLCAPAAVAAELRPVTGKLRVKVGIADQKAQVFDDERLLGLGLRYARRSVAWDALRFKSHTARIDAWVAGARAMGAEPLITFSRAGGVRGRTPPAAFSFLREFQRFRKRYPFIKTYSTWNEANLCGAATCRRPDLVARYYNAIRRNCPGCKVLAADLLDRPNMVEWARAFRRAAGFEPKYWGLHDYVDANLFQTTQLKALLREVKGEVWLTEIGGLVARRNNSDVPLPQGKAHAAQATRFIFDRLARVDRRITRVYLYHWSSSTRRDSWDSAFIGSDDKPRPALAVLKRVLREMRG